MSIFKKKKRTAEYDFGVDGFALLRGGKIIRTKSFTKISPGPGDTLEFKWKITFPSSWEQIEKAEEEEIKFEFGNGESFSVHI
jgi:hypothetical protein